MEAVVVSLEEFQIVGFSFSANLKEVVEQQLGKKVHEELLARAEEIVGKTCEDVYLVQVYPLKPGFDVNVDAFTLFIGYRVAGDAQVPSGMVRHAVPAHEYVKATHQGPESELGRTYQSLYARWLPAFGREFAGFDFEIWDARYQPECAENEIDVHVAVR